MAGYRIPGPLCSTTSEPIDSGTTCLQRSALSGPIRDARQFSPGKPMRRSRLLTAGEVAMARSLFGLSVDYSRVRIHNEEYLWFGLQDDDTAMTPNGEMYFNPKRFKEDFSASGFGDSLWFMHEMVHVWQYQLGYPVKLRGAVRIGLSYSYTLEDTKRLGNYDMEAQGNILSDYWALKNFKTPPLLSERKHSDDLTMYEKVLETFLADPSDKASLPR